MSPRILGYAVLVYAVFTSGMVLHLVGFILGQRNVDWWVVGGTALWFVFVFGGLGLIARRAWSRLVLLVAAATWVVLSIVGLVLLWKPGVPLDAMLFEAVMILPVLAIFAGALSLPAPAAWQVQPPSGQPTRRVASPRIDMAYGCFAWIAFAVSFEKLCSLLPHDLGQFLFMLLWLPLVLATLAAGLAAVVLSILEWREWPLLTMSATLASMFFAFLAVDVLELVNRDVTLIWYVGCTALLVSSVFGGSPLFGDGQCPCKQPVSEDLN